jgi:hypothetical protein
MDDESQLEKGGVGLEGFSTQLGRKPVDGQKKDELS